METFLLLWTILKKGPWCNSQTLLSSIHSTFSSTLGWMCLCKRSALLVIHEHYDSPSTASPGTIKGHPLTGCHTHSSEYKDCRKTYLIYSPRCLKRDISLWVYLGIFDQFQHVPTVCSYSERLSIKDQVICWSEQASVSCSRTLWAVQEGNKYNQCTCTYVCVFLFLISRSFFPGCNFSSLQLSMLQCRGEKKLDCWW